MYRTAAHRGAPDTVVVCRACGGPSSVALAEAGEGSFTCKGCGTEQPLLRPADDTELASVALVDQHATDAYEELAPLLSSLGAAGKAHELAVECDGIRIVVSLSLNSGVVTGLDMTARAPGLLDMTLVRENALHRDAKSTGLIREVQTGDEAFDAAVYIESSARDQDVRAVLAAPAVRWCVMRLLTVADKVRLDGGAVKVFVPKTEDAFGAAAVRERLGWLRVVAGAPRPIGAEDAPVPMRTTIAKVVTYLFAPLGLGSVILGSMTYQPIAARPYVVGGAVGLVLAVLVHPFMRRALAGRSTSHRDSLAARVASLVFVPLLAAGVLLIWNGGMDRSSERVVVMNVTSSHVDDDDSEKIHVTTVDEAGETHGYTFTAPLPKTPARVAVSWRSGALGFTWQSGRARLIEGAER